MDIYTGQNSGGLTQDTVSYVTDLGRDTIANDLFFTTRWTSKNMQIPLMSVPVGSDIGIDMHQNSDKIFYIVRGNAFVVMGNCQECLTMQVQAYEGYAITVPARTWHNVINIGQIDLKMFAVFAPALYSSNAVYETKEKWLEHYEN
jgi:mannose-6-phosphate isomerase-like protein (cupin superfamily)